ncbi:MAG: alpha,alpha-trehalase TreF [Bacteroidota bacterium]
MRLLYARIGAMLLLTFSMQACQEVETSQAPPQSLNMVQAFPDLFPDVQMAGIFPDSKTFADCTPTKDPKVINEAYAKQKDQPDFGLQEFISAYFELPPQISSGFQADTSRSVSAHINTLWPVLTRASDNTSNTSLLPLPYPYIVPGGRFREIYYWDSYFTMLGLQVSDDATGKIRPMIQNFAHLIETVGYVPNGNRTYFVGRSQPPFFSLMVRLLAEVEGNKVLAEFLPAMEKEYQFWMTGQDQLSEDKPAIKRIVKVGATGVMNRYWDNRPVPRPESYKEDVELAEKTGREPEKLYRDLRAACESGWDFSSRWLRDPQDLGTIHTTEILPVDLNALLYHLELTLSESYEINGNAEKRVYYERKAADRKTAMQQIFWDQDMGMFLDYDWIAEERLNRPSLATAFPLYFKIATVEQAEATAQKVEELFLQPGGVLTTAVETGQQWDAPNGWAPLQWMTIAGLRNYDQNALSDKIKQRWVALNRKVYKGTGKLVEKYNVTDVQLEAGGGEYPLQDGFGWTNGVLLRLVSE